MGPDAKRNLTEERNSLTDDNTKIVDQIKQKQEEANGLDVSYKREFDTDEQVKTDERLIKSTTKFLEGFDITAKFNKDDNTLTFGFNEEYRKNLDFVDVGLQEKTRHRVGHETISPLFLPDVKKLGRDNKGIKNSRQLLVRDSEEIRKQVEADQAQVKDFIEQKAAKIAEEIAADNVDTDKILKLRRQLGSLEKTEQTLRTALKELDGEGQATKRGGEVFEVENIEFGDGSIRQIFK